MKNLVFDEVYKSGIVSLRLVLAHPFIPHDRNWIARLIPVYSVFTLVFINLVYNIYYDFKEGLDLVTICSHIILASVYCVTSFQYAVAIFYQKPLASLMKDMINDFNTYAGLPEKERDVIYDYAMKGSFVVKLWTCAVIANAGIYPFGALVMTLHSHIKGAGRIYPIFEVVYPEPLDSYKDNMFMFLGLNTMSMIYCVIAIGIYAGTVPLGPIFMLHACGQLTLIKLRVERLFLDEHYTPAGVDTYLREMIGHLQYIYSFVDRIRTALQLLYEMALNITVVCISVAGFLVVKTTQRGEFQFEFLSFFVSGFVYCFVPCFFGDLLISSGEAVRLAVYSCGWECEWHRPARVIILNVLTRSVYPIAIRSVFKTVSLDAFSDAVRQSYFVFNLLMAAMD